MIKWLLPILGMLCPMFAENQNPKVVVVGAGLAGLTTAYRLEQKGLEVSVYEARSRVGGRILSAKIGDSIVELGGQNIYDGGDSKNLLRLIDELDLELFESKININYCYFTGSQLISIQEILKERKSLFVDLKARLDAIVLKSRNMRDVLAHLFDEEDVLYKIFSVRLSGFEGGVPECLSSSYTRTLYAMLFDDMTLLFSSDEEIKNENFLSLKGGNSLLPIQLTKELRKQVYLNHVLVSVEKGPFNHYLLTFHNGHQVTADILVLAIPCSVYPDVDFHEIIPKERLEKIYQIPYGTNAKILTPFFCPPSKKMVWFNDRIGSFFEPERKILTFYYTGDASRFSKETIQSTYCNEWPMIEMEMQDQCLSWPSPVMARDESFCVYDGAVGYSWVNDPYVKGSYSYIAPGQEIDWSSMSKEGKEVVKTLFAPIDQKIHFAGEHASVLIEGSGSMEAACESGERTARMITEFVNKHP